MKKRSKEVLGHTLPPGAQYDILLALSQVEVYLRNARIALNESGRVIDQIREELR